MKGQSKFIGYMLTVLFSIIVLAVISALIYNFYQSALDVEINSELTQIAIKVKDSVIKIYDIGKNSKVQPSNYSSILISELDLNLPRNVGNLNYEVSLVTAAPLFTYLTKTVQNDTNVSGVKQTSVARIIAKTIQDPIVNVEFDLPNIDLSVQGKVRNGVDDVLRYYRHNENVTVYDTVILGQFEIILRLTKVS